MNYNRLCKISDSWPQSEGDFMNQEEQLQSDLDAKEEAELSLEDLEAQADSCETSFDEVLAAVEAIPSDYDFDFCDPVAGPDGKLHLSICTNGDGQWAWVAGKWEQLNADGSIGDSAIKDSEDVTRQAEYAVQPEHVYDLYNNGKVEINIPSGADGEEFGKACVEVINDLWDDPDVNFHYPNCKFKTAVSGNKLIIETICDAKKDEL